MKEKYAAAAAVDDVADVALLSQCPRHHLSDASVFFLRGDVGRECLARSICFFPFLIVSMYSNLYTTVIRIRKGHSCGAEGGTIAFLQKGITRMMKTTLSKNYHVFEKKQKVSIKNKTAFD